MYFGYFKFMLGLWFRLC